MVEFAPRRLAIVHAHPDDESLFTGHLIAHALATGAEVKLITLTRGQQGQARNPELRSVNKSAEMAEYRSNALSRALASFPGLEHQFLGTRAYLETNQDQAGWSSVFDRPADYRLTLTGAGPKVVADELVPVLKRFRPDAIVTLSPSDGNSDHKTAFKTVRRALRVIRAARPPKHYTVGFKGQIAVGNEQTEVAKRAAIACYSDFVSINRETFDYGTGEISFSAKEFLTLVR